MLRLSFAKKKNIYKKQKQNNQQVLYLKNMLFLVTVIKNQNHAWLV